MRPRRRHVQPGAIRRGHQFPARAVHLVQQLLHVFADIRARLHDGLVHLQLHLVGNARRSRGHQVHHVRTQFARHRVNNLKLFFDADGKTVSHSRPSGA